MFSSISRIIKFAWRDFFRNFWLSFVTLTILVLTLFSINLLVVFNLLAKTATSAIEDKINISVYFKSEIAEDQIMAVENYLQSLPETKQVVYVSREQALNDFKVRHKDNEKILQSLDELGSNPLGASLVVTAKSTADYVEIMKELSDQQYDSLIESKNFDDHQTVVEKIGGITSRVNIGVALIALIFTLISLLIIFNAVRMAIYTHREEIIAMKLLGATNWFIQAPFLLEGVIFGVLSVLAIIIIIYPLLGVIQPYVSLLLGANLNLVNYFNQNFLIIFGLELIGAILINLVSSYWAVNKYVKV